MNIIIKKIISESILVKSKFLSDDSVIETIEKITASFIQAFRNQKKVLFCGNGGSAADAQHLYAELSGRFFLNRPPLYAEALHCNTSYLTAVSNDFSFEESYSRLIEGMGQQGDILVALSTSGKSKNIIHALQVAKIKKMIVIGFTGSNPGEMKEYCDLLLQVPSSNTPRIQEGHMLAGHIICELTEAELFSK
ncbi:MAG: D-sedoheptulose-7-phosphate isomerase [Chitinophagaceae bacterium]